MPDYAQDVVSGAHAMRVWIGHVLVRGLYQAEEEAGWERQGVDRGVDQGMDVPSRRCYGCPAALNAATLNLGQR